MSSGRDGSADACPDPGPLTTLHVRRAVGGDAESLAWLVERLNPLLLAHAAWRIGPSLRAHIEPADLVHEAWLVLLPRLASLPARDGRMTPVLLTFLTTTILNKLHNLLRKEARRRLHTGADEAAEPVADPRASAVAAAVRGEAECVVRAALAALDEGDREVVLMRGIEQQDPDAVAAHFGISRGTMSKRYCRALAKLRARLPESAFAELIDE